METNLTKTPKKIEDLMDELSNYIIDLILENPQQYLLKQSKKGGKVKKTCKSITQSL